MRRQQRDHEDQRSEGAIDRPRGLEAPAGATGLFFVAELHCRVAIMLKSYHKIHNDAIVVA